MIYIGNNKYKLQVGNTPMKFVDEIVEPLPYDEYEYVLFNGYAYIQTSIKPENHCVIATADLSTNSMDKPLFGTQSGGNYFHLTPYNNKYYWGLAGSEGNGGIYSSGKHSIKYNYGEQHEVIIDGDIIGSGSDISSQNYLLTIGRRGSRYGSGWKIYSFQIVDRESNQTILNMIPCTYQGEAGMWDVVSNQFYGNANSSGTLTAGNDI